MKYLEQAWNFIDGKKTYTGATIAGIAAFMKFMSWIDQDTFEVLMGIAGAISIYGVRHALSKPARKR